MKIITLFNLCFLMVTFSGCSNDTGDGRTDTSELSTDSGIISDTEYFKNIDACAGLKEGDSCHPALDRSYCIDDKTLALATGGCDESGKNGELYCENDVQKCDLLNSNFCENNIIKEKTFTCSESGDSDAGCISNMIEDVQDCANLAGNKACGTGSDKDKIMEIESADCSGDDTECKVLKNVVFKDCSLDGQICDEDINDKNKLIVSCINPSACYDKNENDVCETETLDHCNNNRIIFQQGKCSYGMDMTLQCENDVQDCDTLTCTDETSGVSCI